MCDDKALTTIICCQRSGTNGCSKRSTGEALVVTDVLFVSSLWTFITGLSVHVPVSACLANCKKYVKVLCYPARRSINFVGFVKSFMMVVHENSLFGQNFVSKGSHGGPI